MNRTYTMLEISRIAGLDEITLSQYIEREWIVPAEPSELDHEDLARIKLILELQRDLGANEESIPIILHLMDQLHYLRRRLQAEVDRSLHRPT